MPDRKLPMEEFYKMKKLTVFFAVAIWTGWINFLGFALGYAQSEQNVVAYLIILGLVGLYYYVQWPLLPVSNLWRGVILTLSVAVAFAAQLLLL